MFVQSILVVSTQGEDDVSEFHLRLFFFCVSTSALSASLFCFHHGNPGCVRNHRQGPRPMNNPNQDLTWVPTLDLTSAGLYLHQNRIVSTPSILNLGTYFKSRTSRLTWDFPLTFNVMVRYVPIPEVQIK